MNPTLIAKLLIFSLITLCHSQVKSEKFVHSPLLKEIEHKKALLNRKPSPNKTILVTRKKPVRNLKPLYQQRAIAQENEQNAQHNKAAPVMYLPPSVSSTGNGSQVVSNTKNRKSGGGGKDSKETPASDRMFLPPYKYPLWGMPYGIYSNGGFVNPGLFPFVPGGPGFPPYDGIFGGPFGGPFPGANGPLGPGPNVPLGPGGFPMVTPGAPVANAAGVPPAPSATPAASGIGPYFAYGQPPLNPTERNSKGPPPGAYSPGSPVGYRKPPENKPPARPPATRSKPRPRPRPRTTPMPKMQPTDCGCSKHRPHNSYRYEAPQQHHNDHYRRPRPQPTTTTTTAPCPYHHHVTPAPQYAPTPTQAPYTPPSIPDAPAYAQPGPPYHSYPTPPPYSPPSTTAAPAAPPETPLPYSPPPTPAPYSPPPTPYYLPSPPAPPPSTTAPPAAPPPMAYYSSSPPAPPPEASSTTVPIIQPSTQAPYYPPPSTPAAPESTTSTTPPPSYPSPSTTTTTPPPQYPSPPPSQDPPQYPTAAPPAHPQQQYMPPSPTAAPQPPTPPAAPPQHPMGWNGWQPPSPMYLNYQPMPPAAGAQSWEKMQAQTPAPPPSSPPAKSYQPEPSEHLAIYQPPPPPQYNSPSHYSPHHRYPGTKKPCKLKVRPKVPKLFPFEYKPPAPTQPTPPPTPRSKKPCPYKLRAQQAELLQQQQQQIHQLQQQQYVYTTPPTTTTIPPLTLPPTQPPTTPPTPSTYQYHHHNHHAVPAWEQEQPYDPDAILYKPNPQEIVHTPSGSVTVPLPFPFVMDSNGVLKPKNPTGSQQITYKLDMHPDLVSKISTPLVINKSSHSQNPYEHVQQQYGHISRSGIDRQEISSRNAAALASASSTHPQIIVLDASPKSKKKSGQVVQQPSVVVINSEPNYDYDDTPEIQPTIPLSYLQSTIKATPTTSYSSLSDYSYVISEPARKRTRVKASPHYETISVSSYQPRSEKPKRNNRVNPSENKNYVIIDKEELEELENSSDDNNEDEMVRLQFHSLKPEEDEEEEDDAYVNSKPLYSSTSYRQKHRKRKPQRQSSYMGHSGDSIATSSNSFSRIFALNNEGITSVGTTRHNQKSSKRKNNPERLYFDTCIQEVEVDEDKKRK